MVSLSKLPNPSVSMIIKITFLLFKDCDVVSDDPENFFSINNSLNSSSFDSLFFYSSATSSCIISPNSNGSILINEAKHP